MESVLQEREADGGADSYITPFLSSVTPIADMVVIDRRCISCTTSLRTSTVSVSLRWYLDTFAQNLTTRPEVRPPLQTVGHCNADISLSEALILDIEKDKQVALKSLERPGYRAYMKDNALRRPGPEA